MNNLVLGIDPGFDRLGLAVLSGTNTKQELLYSECVETNRRDEHAKRLMDIGLKVRRVIGEWQPQALAVEKLFFNQNATNALKVSEARGVVLYEAKLAGLTVFEYSPQEVKIAVAGYGKADKRAVETMVRRMVSLSPEKKMLDDELDAIAAGICHLASFRKSVG